MPLKTAAPQTLQATHVHCTAPPTINSILLTNNYITTNTHSLLHSLDYDTFLSCSYQLVHGEIFHECNNQTSCGRVLICSPEGWGVGRSMSQYNNGDSNKKQPTLLTEQRSTNCCVLCSMNRSYTHTMYIR